MARGVLVAGMLALLPGMWLRAARGQVEVRHRQGTLRGLLVARDEAGRLLAEGDLTQTVAGDEVTDRLTYHFRDGSLDDETAVFRQEKTFRLVRDRHIQRGRFFKHPEDVTIDVAAGTVTERAADGVVEGTEHMNLPAELANGMEMVLAENLNAEAAETDLPLLAMTPKPRLVKLAIRPDGEQSFRVDGFGRRAKRFRIHIDLGGIEGVVAPLVGKQPPDIEIWVLEGDAPLLVRERGISYVGGPVLDSELPGLTWPAGRDGR